MANVYEDKPAPEKPVPEQKRDAQTGKKTMGVYDRPRRRGPSTGVIIAVIIALVILIAIILSTGFAKPSKVSFRADLPHSARIIETSAGVAAQPGM